jgi:flagella basal body P-ring formation protein FlgA
MPAKIMVKTASRKIHGSVLLDYARDYIKTNIPYKLTNLEIEENYYPKEIVIPDSAYSLKVQLNNNELLGRITLPLDIIVNGHKYKKIYIGLQVNAYKELIVAQKNVIKGEKIIKNDFQRKKMNLNNVNGNPIAQWDNPLLENSVARQPIGQGQVLTERHLKKPLLIGWGDQIQAEVIVGQIRASTMVQARGSGRKGDFIQVENLRTGQKFRARIINTNLVRIIRK